MLNVLTVKTIPVICNSAVKSNRHVHILANQKYLSIWFGAGHSACKYSMFDVCSHRAFCLFCWRKCLPLDSGECLKNTPIMQISANRDFKYSNTTCIINVFTVFLVPCYIYRYIWIAFFTLIMNFHPSWKISLNISLLGKAGRGRQETGSSPSITSEVLMVLNEIFHSFSFYGLIFTTLWLFGLCHGTVNSQMVAVLKC